MVKIKVAYLSLTDGGQSDCIVIIFACANLETRQKTLFIHVHQDICIQYLSTYTKRVGYLIGLYI